MSEFTFYLMKLLTGSAIMYLGYRLWLANNQYVGMVRWYLLASLALPPLLSLSGSLVPASDTALPVIRVSIQQEAVVVTGQGASVVDKPFITASLLYYIAAGFFCLLFLYRLFRIILIICRSKSLRYYNLRLHFSKNKLSPFSFFNNILISQTFLQSGRLRSILVHEAAHITQGHSYDIVFTEMMCILQWFNPFVWLFRNAIQQNHEYLADRAVMKVNCNPANYKALLLESLTGISMPIVNSFNNSSLKMRFIMLNKPISGRGALGQTLATVSLLLVFTTTVILMFQKESFASVLPESASVINDDTTSRAPYPFFEVDVTGDNNEKSLFADFTYPEAAKNSGKQGTVYISFTVSDHGKASGHKVLRGFDKECDEEALRVVKSWKWMPAFKNGKPVIQDVVYPIKFVLDGSEQTDGTPASITKNGSIFQVVDTMPRFPGSREGMVSYLAKNIVYPQKARSEGIQGTVYVSFVVETDGSVTEPKILRGFNRECDEVALDAVKKMPRWKPGSQGGQAVRVQMNIPVKFSLDLAVDKNEKVVSAEGKAGLDEAYSVVDVMPEFPGGDEKRLEFLANNLKFPKKAREKGIQGTVFVTFVVDKDGLIKDVRILRGIGGDCDEAAVNVVKMMPRWKPGMLDGKPVSVQFNMPLKFTLTRESGKTR